MKRVWFLTGFLALLLGGVANAATIASIGTGCIQILDKNFCDFAVSDNIDPTTVNVSVGSANGYEFITFGGPFNTTSSIDFQLYYSVQALSGLIASIDQQFNLSAGGTGGQVSVGETVFDAEVGGNLVAQSSVGFLVTCDCNDPPGENFQGDLLTLSTPLPKVWVTKDIFLDANAGGSVGATSITQSFHQTAVPEPIHYSLLLSGGLMVGLYFKSRKRAQG